MVLSGYATKGLLAEVVDAIAGSVRSSVGGVPGSLIGYTFYILTTIIARWNHGHGRRSFRPRATGQGREHTDLSGGRGGVSRPLGLPGACRLGHGILTDCRLCALLGRTIVVSCRQEPDQEDRASADGSDKTDNFLMSSVSGRFRRSRLPAAQGARGKGLQARPSALPFRSARQARQEVSSPNAGVAPALRGPQPA